MHNTDFSVNKTTIIDASAYHVISLYYNMIST